MNTNFFDLIWIPASCIVPETKGVPSYLWCEKWVNEWIHTWELVDPNITFEDMVTCFGESWWPWQFLSGSVEIVVNGNDIYIDTNTVYWPHLIWWWSSFNNNILTIGNHQYNLADMLNWSLIYWTLSDWNSSDIIENNWFLILWTQDWMRFELDENWVLIVWLPTSFVTLPHHDPEYHPLWHVPWSYYNPWNYVLTWYQTMTSQGELNCWEAVWSEENCCPNVITFDRENLMVSIWWDQTYLDLYHQHLQLDWNKLCIEMDYYPWFNIWCESVITEVTTIPATALVNQKFLNNATNQIIWYQPMHLENSANDHRVDLWNGRWWIDPQYVWRCYVEDTQTTYYWNGSAWTSNPYTQCVDLTHVNDQYLELDYENCSLTINDIYHHEGQPCENLICSNNTIDISDYLSIWTCCTICSCLLDRHVSETEWFSWPDDAPASWQAFIATDPTIREVITFLTKRLAEIYNRVNSSWRQRTVTWTFFPDCWWYFPKILREWNYHPCNDCSNCCDDKLEVIESYAWYSVASQNNYWTVINSRQHVAMRWLTEDWMCQKEFNWEIDKSWNICDPDNHNLAWFDTWDVFKNAYAFNPTALPWQQISLPYDNISWLKIPYDWVYNTYLDWPVKLNHMVHGLRISLVIQRWSDRILIHEWKIDWDEAGWWAITNAYYKEEKIYYAHSSKLIPLKRWDIMYLRVKIDANCSRPWADLDPISLGRYWVASTLFTTSQYAQTAANRYIYWDSWWNIDWGWSSSFGQTVSEWIYLEYGWPSSATHQNFMIADPNNTPTPPQEAQRVYHWLNWFFRTWTVPLTHAAHQYCPGIDFTHNHNIVARFPAIAPQAPKFIHMNADRDDIIGTMHLTMNYHNSHSLAPETNVSNRFTPAYLNWDNTWTYKSYSCVWEDQYAEVTLMSNWVVDETWCPDESWYNHISQYEWFHFWWSYECDQWPNQADII